MFIYTLFLCFVWLCVWMLFAVVSGIASRNAAAWACRHAWQGGEQDRETLFSSGYYLHCWWPKPPCMVLCTSQNLSGPMGKANTHHIQTHAIPAQIYSFLPNRTIGFVVAFDFVHRVRDVDVQGHSWILARATIGRVRIEILYMRMHSRSLDGQMARTKKKYKNHKWIAMH